MQHEVLKVNLSTFSDLYMLPKKNGHLDDYLGKMHSTGLCKHNRLAYNPIEYMLMDVDTVQWQLFLAYNRHYFYTANQTTIEIYLDINNKVDSAIMHIPMHPSIDIAVKLAISHKIATPNATTSTIPFFLQWRKIRVF